ncbi:Tryptophan halogenase [Pseudoalteromonas luteoviolacea B = ATCC 29581]|nr:Tryptophan halogenase [Pseudoalteromonas luteoviolacea B = ATCC 29581]
MADNLKHFVIVGGGTAGWLAAATLGKALIQSGVTITLVESPTVPTIGVGEATIPPLITVLRDLGINLSDFMQKTDASLKLGIQFEDWHTVGQHYFHPFGQLGRPIDGMEFFQCWLKAKSHGEGSSLMAHSPEAQLAFAGNFVEQHTGNHPLLNQAQFALHLDAGKAAEYLKTFSIALGVNFISANVTDVSLNSDNQIIQKIVLDNGHGLEGDFFIDCSGFQSLLLGHALDAEFEDWRAFLPCDRAIAVQTCHANEDNIAPFTRAIAHRAGWSWHIPLQSRMGNGIVYASQYMSDDEALAQLTERLSGKMITSPRVIKFKTGVRKTVWKGNCLALGLAQGFIEPLESTAIHLVTKTLAVFLRYFPSNQIEPSLQERVNQLVFDEYLQIRDFLIAHYCFSERKDSRFWQWCQTDMPKPNSLHKLELRFKELGSVFVANEALFQSTSWYAVLDGMKVIPSRYNGILDRFDIEKLINSLTDGASSLARSAQQQISHRAFLDKYCPSDKEKEND